MKKNRCQLCGGKIRNGRCELCGWINQTDKEYLLNKSRCDDEPLTHVHKEKTFGSWSAPSEQKKAKPKTSTRVSGGGSLKSSKKSNQKSSYGSAAKSYQKTSYGTKANKKAGSGTTTYSYQSAGSAKKKKKNGSCLAAIIIFIVVINVVPHILGIIVNEISDKTKSITSFVENSKSERVVEDDQYEFVKRELSEDGEEWSEAFTAGQYIVGVDIPEGEYQLEVSQGTGLLNVSDDENSIYIYQYFSAEPKEEEVCELNEVRLYEGAEVEVRDGLTLNFASQNAQTEKLHSMKNPLTDEILLESGESYVVGENLDAGVYDISVTEDWGTFTYEVPVEGTDEYMDYHSVFMDVDYGQDGIFVYRNVTLPKGTQVTVEGTSVTLTPSSRIVSPKYIETYR